MKPEIQEMLLKEIETGKYNVSHNCLKKVDKNGIIYHCVQGILCELHARVHGIAWDMSDYPNYSYCGEANLVPKNVMEWAGLRDDLGSYYPDGVNRISLVSMNSEGSNYSEIVKFLRSYTLSDILQSKYEKSNL